MHPGAIQKRTDWYLPVLTDWYVPVLTDWYVPVLTCIQLQS